MMRYLWEEAHGGHYAVSGPFEQCPEAEVVAASDYDAAVGEVKKWSNKAVQYAARIRELEAFLAMWVGDGNLQTFEHREEFRADARGLLGYTSETKGEQG